MANSNRDFRVCECGHLDFMHVGRQDCGADVPIDTQGTTRQCECEQFRRS